MGTAEPRATDPAGLVPHPLQRDWYQPMLASLAGGAWWLTLLTCTLGAGWQFGLGGHGNTLHLYLADLPLLCTIGMWAAMLLLHPNPTIRYGPRPTVLALAGLGALALIGAPFAAHPELSLGMAARLSLLLAFYLYTVNRAPSAPSMASALLGGLAVQLAVAMGQVWRQGSIGLGLLGERHLDLAVPRIAVVSAYGRHWLRPYGLTAHPNLLAGIAAVCLLPLATALPVRLVGWGTGCVVALLALTLSRGAWLAALAAVVIYLVATRGRRGRPRISRPTLALAAVLLGGAALSPLRAALFARFNLVDPLEQQSIQERLDSLRDAAALIGGHPLLGVGANGYVAAERARRGLPAAGGEYVPVVHNAVLLATSELGLAGGALLALALGWPAFRAIRDGDTGIRAALAAGLAACLVAGMVDFTPWASPSFRLLWVALLGLWAASTPADRTPFKWASHRTSAVPATGTATLRLPWRGQRRPRGSTPMPSACHASLDGQPRGVAIRSQSEVPRRHYTSLNCLGYGGLLLLAAALPFELTQRPLLRTRYLTVTNLKLLEYPLVLVALLTLLPVARAAIARAMRREPGGQAAVQRAAGSDSGVGIGASAAGPRSWPKIAWLAGLCLVGLLSSLGAADRLAGLKWTFDLAVAGLLWLAIPLWLEGQAGRIERLTLAVVAGAVGSALIGLGEFAFGMPFAQSLTLFKPKPTLAGSHLRLSATFEYANIAAMYYELTLFLALAALLAALCAPRLRWGRLAVLLLATLVLLEAMLLTYSRGALLGLLTGVVAFGWLARSNTALRALALARCRLGLLAIVPALALIAGTAAGGPLSVLRLNGQSDQEWYRASYAAPMPIALPGCERLRIPLTVTNRGPLTWWATGDDRYRLGYHWLFPSGQMAFFEGLRTPLPRDLGSGGYLKIGATLLTPSRPGHYLLVWDMVEEGVTWFSLKSASYHAVPVVVTRAPARRCTVPGAQAGLAPTSLPRVQSEPPRSRLWAAALTMLHRHPLLGIGPDGFRLAYGIYTVPPQHTWDRRILANSLYLEILADLGLAGAACFLAAIILAIVAGRNALRDRGTELSPAAIGALAAIVALLGHGLVDYSLQSHAIFLLCWILCGMLAASLRRDAGVVRAGQ